MSTCQFIPCELIFLSHCSYKINYAVHHHAKESNLLLSGKSEKPIFTSYLTNSCYITHKNQQYRLFYPPAIFCYAISPSLKISVRSFLALPSRELKITPCPSPFLALKTFVSCPSSVRFLGKKRLFHREEMQTRGMGRLKSMPSPSAIRRHQTRNRRLSACVFLLVKLHNGIKKARVGETQAFFM